MFLGALFISSSQAQNAVRVKGKFHTTTSHKIDNTSSSAERNKESKEEKNYTLPFLEYFDGGTFPPTDWVTYRGTNGAGTSFDWESNTDGYGGSAHCAFVRYENSGYINEDWLVSPLIVLGTNSSLSFYEKQD